MEYENKYSSNGKGNLGVTLGAIGTGLAVMNGGLGNLGGLFGGCGCNGNGAYSRYDAEKDAQISSLQSQIQLRDSNIYVDQKMLELYRYIDGKFTGVEGQLAQQAVYNATNTATIGCISQQIAQLQGLTKVVIPTTSICPEPMARYNSWVAPITTTTAG